MWLSKFLTALARQFRGQPYVSQATAASMRDQAQPGIDAAIVSTASANRESASVIPARQYVPVESPPRTPTVPSDALARYWAKALDYVSFKELGGGGGKFSLPSRVYSLEDAMGRSAAPDEDGQPGAGANVHVVLALTQIRNGRVQDSPRPHLLLAVPAILTDDDLLVPRTEAPPIINESYLAPNVESRCFCLATHDAADERMTARLSAMVSDPTVTPGWAIWWDTALSVLRELLEADSNAKMLERVIELLPADDKPGRRAHVWEWRALVFPADDGGRGQIKATYDAALLALKERSPGVRLFDRLGGTETARPIGEMTGAEVRELISGHIDEYDELSQRRPLFPLDGTQRSAVAAILSLQDGEMQAVNGPPGSGKTSMLRAVVASQWVSAALEQRECPITVACGATNQSVTNVIEAFGKAPHPDGSLPHAQRWIADASSYGAYLPAKERLVKKEHRAEVERFVCLEAVSTGGFLYRYWNRPDVLDPLRVIEYEEAYIARARLATNSPELASLDDAIRIVWERLCATEVARLQFHRNWSSNGPWLAPVMGAVAAAKPFWSASRAEFVGGCIARLQSGVPGDSAEEIQDLLWRADAFHWAARYWEGRFLLAQRERLSSRHRDNVVEALRRICMLTPCIVSTLHSAPRLFEIAWDLKADADPALSHVLGKIDLLVVDEAGQAAPELAAAIFALARRAAVVGDLKQLAPIWNNTSLTEFGVASQTDTLACLDDIIRSHRSVAKGSILALARLLSRWREPDDLGVTLRYHYRCMPNIIWYCNTLTYGGKLKTRTNDDGEGPEPSLAWVAVDATPEPVGGSWRNRREVSEIVSWVVERWPHWQKNPQTQGKPLRDIVALITPYRPQADLLRETLVREFDRVRARAKHVGDWPDRDDVNKVVIGTVHKLQGAERPIVCFSLVEGPEQGGTSFIDTDASLMNVAVSRAKRSFVIFANPDRLFSEDVEAIVRSGKEVTDDDVSKLTATRQLGVHLRCRARAQALYPKRVVFIEAGNKKETLSDILGKSSVVEATGGALTRLPLRGGVDIRAGFVPRPELEGDASRFLGVAAERLRAVDEVVLATDDDRMGEYISWQIRRLLKEGLEGKTIHRSRLGAITQSAVTKAIDTRGELDPRKVSAEIIREIADCLIAGKFGAISASSEVVANATAICTDLATLGALEEDVKADRRQNAGRVQGAIVRLLLAEARTAIALSKQYRFVATIPVGAGQLSGEVVHTGENRATTTNPGAVSALRGRELAPADPPVLTHERAALPEAGTISIMAEAYRRYRLAPWSTAEALQALYSGTWSARNDDSVASRSYEPEFPITPIAREGHPPITPLDEASRPDVLGGMFATREIARVYELVWERYEAAERGPYHVRFASLDLRFAGSSAMCVRVKAVACEPTSRRKGEAHPGAVPDDVKMLMLGASPALKNDVDDLEDAWTRNAFDRVVPVLTQEPAGRWDLTLDALMLVLERLGIGRPSTLARSLHSLVEKSLLVLPAAGGPLRLTPAGVRLALALEEKEPALSAPDFSSTLERHLDAIERGECGPREVLEWVGSHFLSRDEMRDVAPRIWNSLEELEQLMDKPAGVLPAGGLISAQPDGAWPSQQPVNGQGSEA
ncbi:AAA domain-containing protein [Paraburkholderia sp. J8-2]|uniref:AAA domain-containing protein n=1 Tax=Paraburkholderia sp. J8-2 TaxID=2805440 RepID=UPI002AB6C9B8|nr:AAA domain-containing protein [Paraburkholderia sp. J8-2]